MKAISIGTMLMFSTLLNRLSRGLADPEATSFWISNAKSTTTPMNAKEPASPAVVIVDIVDVVIVEITVPSRMPV